MSYSFIKKLVFLFIFTIISFVNSPAQNSTDHIIYQSVKLRTPEELADIEGPSDWRMYQYNAQHTGYNDKDKITVPLTLKWKRKYQSITMHQPTIIGNRFLGSNFRGMLIQDPQPGLICADTKNGDSIWFFPSSFEEISQPCYAYGNLYFQNGSSVRCFDLVTGDSLWRTYYYNQGDYHLCPTVDNGFVALNAGFYGGIYVFDAFNGEFKWWAVLHQYSLWSPAIFHDTVFTYVANAIRIYDLHTGIFLWALSTADFPKISSNQMIGYELNSAPVIDTIKRIMYCIKDKALTAIDIDSHSFIWWNEGQYWNRDISQMTANPVLYQDVIIVIDSSFLKAYDCYTGEEKWRLEGLDFCYTPVGANKLLFCSGIGHTEAIDLETHRVIWTCEVGGWLAVANDNLFINTTNGWTYVYEPIFTDIEDNNSDELPDDYILNQNYPNPFNATTIIEFDLPINSDVKIVIYNSIGQKIRTILDKSMSVGHHTVYWDGTDNNGKTVASGAYFYQLETGDKIQTKKMLLMK